MYAVCMETPSDECELVVWYGFVGKVLLDRNGWLVRLEGCTIPRFVLIWVGTLERCLCNIAAM